MSSSSFARLPALAAALVLAAACGGSEKAPPSPTTPRSLTAEDETVKVPPGGTGVLGFTLDGPSGAPLPGATVSFAIIDVPMGASQGATLTEASAVTDAQGRCTARVSAGLATVFRVRATSANATAEVAVVVGAGQDGAVEVAPFFPVPAGAHAAAVATTIEILLLDNRSCSNIDLRDPPQPARSSHTVPASGATVPYGFLQTNVSYAIVGRARDGGGGVRALGCTDLPGTVLVVGGSVQVALPLVDAGPNPAGTYVATWPLPISPPLPAAASLAATWRDLTDCPLDPAQLLLDCAIDALGPTSVFDPVDCIPTGVQGADGPVGDALVALRGDFLLGPDGAPTRCRGSKMAGGSLSIDAIVQGMFGSPLPQSFVALASAAGDAPRLFDHLQVRSTLDVRAPRSLTDVDVTHTLTNLSFTLPDGSADVSTDVSLVKLGLPVLTAKTSGTVTDDLLTIAPHGFTVRLGQAARAAFGTLSLARRGLPETAPEVVAAVAALAHTDDGQLAGCVAIDEVLCPRVAQPAGCLVTACAIGLNVLAARLDAAFTAADGTDLDLYLSGSAPLLETRADGLADRLGDQPSGHPGTWNIDLRPRDGRRTAQAPWEAIRTGN
jgi:hypothetical protein